AATSLSEGSSSAASSTSSGSEARLVIFSNSGGALQLPSRPAAGTGLDFLTRSDWRGPRTRNSATLPYHDEVTELTCEEEAMTNSRACGLVAVLALSLSVRPAPTKEKNSPPLVTRSRV